MKMARRLDGRLAADQLLDQLQRRKHKAKLATIVVGQRFDSKLYVKLKVAAAKRVGIATEQRHLPERTSEKTLLRLIRQLNHRPSITGILLQLPLPTHLHANRAIQTINPQKDVDGFHPNNTRIVPPPVAAVLKLIALGRPSKHSRVAILGKQTVYTKQLRSVFERRGWTVSIMSVQWTRFTKKSDIIVTVLGRGPKLLGSQVKPRAIVVDVGIRHEYGKTVGDVDQSVWTVAKAVSPVPGGVGPLTVAYLLYNTQYLALTTRR